MFKNDFDRKTSLVKLVKVWDEIYSPKLDEMGEKLNLLGYIQKVILFTL